MDENTDTVHLADALRNTLRELRIELAIGTRRVAAATGLNDSDLDVLDVLARYGAQSPTALARRMGIHPATMTGVLTRLEKAGWVVRRRDVIDRRSVQVEPSGFDRLTALYSDANERLDQIAAQLTPEAGAVILEYLNQVCAAVHEASARLAVDEPTS
ncbi:MAG TPA: MarR family transcriptional regulator [Mycobacterium sp.]|nr:MarR family transcriptional regulator [Mycobacterium sp.]HUH68458.1 MarR family transcriptional regulator [Mycobacterium sp.]